MIVLCRVVLYCVVMMCSVGHIYCTPVCNVGGPETSLTFVAGETLTLGTATQPLLGSGGSLNLTVLGGGLSSLKGGILGVSDLYVRPSRSYFLIGETSAEVRISGSLTYVATSAGNILQIQSWSVGGSLYMFGGGSLYLPSGSTSGGLVQGTCFGAGSSDSLTIIKSAGSSLYVHRTLVCPVRLLTVDWLVGLGVGWMVLCHAMCCTSDADR